MASSELSLKQATSPPSMPEDHVARDALVNRLERYLDRRLILVQAPAGYGKSTLVAAFTERIDRPVCWLRLSAADQDMIRLARLLRASLTGRFHRLRNRLEFDPQPGTSPKSLASRFAKPIRDAVPEPFLIVIDDMQWLNRSEQSAEFIDHLLQELPQNATVLLAGRELPRVSLPEMVMDGRVGGIGMRDLALDRNELADLLESRLSIDIDTEDLERLYEKTQGWITGALLFTFSPERETLASLVPEVMEPTEFFAETVLARVPEDIETFLLESAALPKLTAAACDAVMQREDSGEQLAYLRRKGLFITALQTEPRSYEYHPLFRESLIEILKRTDPKRLQHLRQRAADYFAKEGAVEEAFDLYMASGDPQKAAQLAETTSDRLFVSGQMTTLESWANRLYEADAKAPNLKLLVATVASNLGDYEKASKWLKRADLPRQADSPDERSLTARALNVEGHIALQAGNPERAQQLAHKVLELLPDEGEPVRRSAALRLLATSMNQLGVDLQAAEQYAERAVEILESGNHTHQLGLALLDLTHIRLNRGRHNEAYESGARAHEYLSDSGSALPMAISLNNLAYLEHLNGRYHQAFDWFEQAIEHARSADSLRYEAVILFGQADLFNDLGLRLQAGDLYGEGLRAATRISHTGLIGYGKLQTCTLHRRSGNTRLAQKWLSEAKIQEGFYTEPPVIRMHNCALKISEHPEGALQDLHDIHENQWGDLGADDLTLLRYFQTLAAVEAGKQSLAHRHLRTALDTADIHGTHQILAAEMNHDPRVLELAQTAYPEDPVVVQLRSRIDFMAIVSRRFRRHTETSSQQPPDLSIDALGSVDIRFKGELLSSLPPLPRSLLIFLADQGPVPRDRILETFWPEVDADKQRSSLYTAMHALTSELGKEGIEIEAGLYRLNRVWYVQYDVAEFERTAGIARNVPKGDPRRTFALAEAIEGFRGSFLPGYHEQWVVERRRELEALLLQLLREHAASATADGQLEQARGSLQRALSIDPLRDDLHFSYMRTLARLGRRSEMITHYHEYARLLSRELGVDPPPDVRRFYQEHIG